MVEMSFECFVIEYEGSHYLFNDIELVLYYSLQ